MRVPSAVATVEPLLPLPPVPYPATIEQTGPVGLDATVAFRGARCRGLPDHRAALGQAVLGGFTTLPSCKRKGNHPPSQTARTAAAVLRGVKDRKVVADLARYAELVATVRGYRL